jgi:hypothetical protein
MFGGKAPLRLAAPRRRSDRTRNSRLAVRLLVFLSNGDYKLVTTILYYSSLFIAFEWEITQIKERTHEGRVIVIAASLPL